MASFGGRPHFVAGPIWARTIVALVVVVVVVILIDAPLVPKEHRQVAAGRCQATRAHRKAAAAESRRCSGGPVGT